MVPRGGEECGLRLGENRMLRLVGLTHPSVASGHKIFH